MPLRPALPILPALIFLAASGCNPVEAYAEREIAQRLPEAIGPADRYDVSVEGLRTSSGEADLVTVVGQRVRPEDGPVLDRLDLELRGVRYDEDAKRLAEVESAQATARLLPADLAAYLDAHRNVRESALTLRSPDEATLRLRPEVGGIAVPEGVAVELTGRLVAEGGRVRFDVAEVRAAGLNLGATVARRLSEEINPVLDLTDTDAGLRVTAVRVEPGAVVVEATGDPAGLRLR